MYGHEASALVLSFITVRGVQRRGQFGSHSSGSICGGCDSQCPISSSNNDNRFNSPQLLLSSWTSFSLSANGCTLL